MASTSSLGFLATVLLLLPIIMAANNVLFSGQRLLTGSELSYDKYTFIMQDDCNLVLYNGGWQSNTANNGKHCELHLLNDGRLQIKDSSNGREIWNSNAKGSGNGEYVAVVHPEGKVVVHGPSVWATKKSVSEILKCTAENCTLRNIPEVSNLLFSGQVLYSDGRLSNGLYNFVMQGDCNLVLYNGGWQSNTHGNGKDCFLRLDHYGGLSIRDDGYVKVWSNNVKSKYGDYVAVLKPEGFVVVFGPAIWSTSGNRVDGGIKMVA